jgi:uncharacterized coiled-coil protein SlyX
MFTNSNTYVREVSNTLEVFVKGQRSATFEDNGGILHGSWNVASGLVTSDRRLKTNIAPLQRTLRDVIAPKAQAEKKVPPAGQSGLRGTAGQGTQGTTGAGDGALWLLRQLRPVSYSFRKGADSKNMRFGFIADELESVVPEVVRSAGDKDVTDQKAVVYQDLIALLAAATQSQQNVIEKQQNHMQALEDRMKKLEEAKQEAMAKRARRSRKRKAKKATH